MIHRWRIARLIFLILVAESGVFIDLFFLVARAREKKMPERNSWSNNDVANAPAEFLTTNLVFIDQCGLAEGEFLSLANAGDHSANVAERL